MTRDEKTFAAARRVRAELEVHGARSAMIGALALAAHGFPRGTQDLDLATFTDPAAVLRPVARKLEDKGMRVEFREPGANDPLNGLLIVRTPGANPVEVVNFRPGNRLAREAIETAISLPSVPFPVVDLAHLVALKLRAGGPQDVADAIEVLKRHVPPPLDALREVCGRHRLGKALERVLAAL